MESNDYFSRKLRTQIDEYNAIISMITKDTETNEMIKEEMVEFVCMIFGNRAWVQLV